jgi:hypothetical protein
MKNLRGTFDNLVSTMKRYDLYQKDDEVGMELNELSNLIDEVEKRMECVKRTNVDSHEILFTNQVKLEESIGYDNVEILQRSINDVDIALDLTINEPIECNWYGLFEEPKITQLANQTDISVDDVFNVAMGLGMNPSIEEIKEVLKYYNSVAEESTETWELIVENLLYNCVVPSQQTINVSRETIEDKVEVVPTFLCHSDDIHNVVKDVISKLKDIQVDGETMQYILEQVGMEEQMLRQLVMKADFKDTKDLLREKFENEL